MKTFFYSVKASGAYGPSSVPAGLLEPAERRRIPDEEFASSRQVAGDDPRKPEIARPVLEVKIEAREP